jgi:circadian clock protein KaiC
MTISPSDLSSVPLLKTGIPGLDQLAYGGLPARRTTTIAGTAGSGKTVLALNFLVAGAVQLGEHGVLCTFEESPEDLISNVKSFGWNLDELIESGALAVVDATQQPGDEVVEAGSYDLSGLLVRLEHAIRSHGAKRVVLDAAGGIFAQFGDANVVRSELCRIKTALRQFGVTTLLTMERVSEDGEIGRYGVEEFIADNVIILRNRLENENRRRTIELLKVRGAAHQKGEYPFTIDPREGVMIIPLSATALVQRSSTVRVSSGVTEMDAMCGGGMYRDSIVLVSGATGTGKTLIVTQFVKAAIDAGERAIIFGAEESREQMCRNATSWGIDLEDAEERGLLRIICRYPEVMGLEDHIIQIRRELEDFKPARIAVDSMSAFERASSMSSFREFMLGLTSHIKHLEMTGLFTSTTSMLLGGDSITETHISTITDTIILLRYIELNGEIRRAIAILKMRGTVHERQIREYTINDSGMQIGDPFTGIHGILTGSPTYRYFDESASLNSSVGPGVP